MNESHNSTVSGDVHSDIVSSRILVDVAFKMKQIRLSITEAIPIVQPMQQHDGVQVQHLKMITEEHTGS